MNAGFTSTSHFTSIRKTQMQTYYEADDQTYRKDSDGSEQIANFTARITRETTITDGINTVVMLTLSGKQDDASLPDITISTEKFIAMNWPLASWGVRCIIPPGGSNKEDMRHAIQSQSKPVSETIYQHTGWVTADNKPAYLHGGGAITAQGNTTAVKVDLPPDLNRFVLPKISEADKIPAIRALIETLHLAPPRITWPLLAATVAPPLEGIDFGMHITGRTGAKKSELASIYQSAYGAGMDARHLPCSWSSTANALEAQTYRTKDALVVIDDYVPIGGRMHALAMAQKADQVFRGLGNQQGRSRLTDASSLQRTMYPRGLVLSTGEDTPEGHSVRGRMLILELTPNDVDLPALSKSQSQRPLFSQAMAHWITYIARYKAKITETMSHDRPAFRDMYLGIGHARTPAIIAELLLATEAFLLFAQEAGAITALQRAAGMTQAKAAIVEAARKQDEYLTDVDPCQQWVNAIRNMLASQLVHVDAMKGGIPLQAESLGWTAEHVSGQITTYKSHGKLIGWADWDQDALYIDAGIGYEIVAAKAKTPLTKATMFKRLKEGGHLQKVNDAQQRNTVRVTCDNRPRTVLALSLALVLDTAEAPAA
jgi:hypothetical protein